MLQDEHRGLTAGVNKVLVGADGVGLPIQLARLVGLREIEVKFTQKARNSYVQDVRSLFLVRVDWN